VSDIDTVAVDSLKALDPNGPIREADIACMSMRSRLERNRFQLNRLALQYLSGA